jgi:MFS family permease
VRVLADLRPLREHRDFGRLWTGTTLSSVGGAMTSFAVTLQVYQLTHSSAAVGAIGLALAVPIIMIGLYGGSLADSVDRRTLVLITSSCLAIVSAVFAVQAYADLHQLWLLYALVAVQSLLGALDAPARRTFVVRLLPDDRVPAGVALNQLAFQVSFVAGPALGGLVTAAWGLRACYLIDALSFAAALYGVARLPRVPPHDAEGTRPGVSAVLDGLRFIRRHRVLAGAFLADLDAMVLGMPFALFPAINAAQFGGSPRTLGLLTAAPAVGGVIGSTFSGPVGHVRRQGRAMLVAVVVWGAAVAGFGLSRTLWLSVVLLGLAGAADTTSVVFRATIVQVATPDRFRGRVTAADYVVGAGGPQLGNVRAGAIGSLASPAFSAVSGGLAAAAGAVVLAFAVPDFARYEPEPPVTSPTP